MKNFFIKCKLLGMAIVIIGLISCSPTPEEKGNVVVETPAVETKSLHEQQIEKIKERYPIAETTASGLCYIVNQEGEGETTPAHGQQIKAHYTGLLWDGHVFDSSADRGPLAFNVGTGRVISGWDEAFLSMKKGEKRTLIIPSRLAYGESGFPGAIPGNAILTFEVELVDF